MSRIDDPAQLQAFAHRLVELRQAHRDLDTAIHGLQDARADELAIQRLKKRKLQLKDRIALLERALVPDEPA
ncbi:MAG: YdcH family protein [Pseudoxanthomonas suwonensis]|nr:YdcH family protein [Pseudoxanthomonas suwonensis]